MFKIILFLGGHPKETNVVTQIQIVGGFSQDSGEAGLCYQQPPTPGSVVKNLPAWAGETSDMGLISGLGGSPGEGNGNSLQSTGSPKSQIPLRD